MKWVFLLSIVLAVPLLTAFLRGNPRNLVQGSFVLGASILILGPSLWAAPIPWPQWPGPVKGLEVSFVDSISVALILSTKPVRIPWSIKAAFVVLCVALVISTAMARQWMPSFFYAWQLFRSALLFVAIARTCGVTRDAAIALIAGLGLGLVYEGVLAVYQYHNGVQRPGGNLGHSNSLGIASEFVTFPVLALMLGTRRLLWPITVLLSAFAIAVVGGSRATVGLFAIGTILTFIFSLRRGSTSRKVTFASIGVLFLLVSSPVMMWGINHRSTEAQLSSDSDREAMKDAGRMIIADHPFGVGANQYVVVANTGGYSERAGVPWNTENRSAPVHDTYYLVTAELGFIGLFGLSALLAAFILVAFVNLKGNLGEEGQLVPGLLSTLIVLCIHIAYEWVFMEAILHYMFAVATGLLVGTTSQIQIGDKVGSSRQPSTTRSRVARYS